MEWPLSVSREEHTSERDIVVYTGRKRVSTTGHGKARLSDAAGGHRKLLAASLRCPSTICCH